MAYPFGGHPRFEEYLEWARRTQGCTYTSGFSQIDGKVETFVCIENPANGKHIIYYAAMKEFLTGNAVSTLDRRLGLDSPFPKLVGYNDND
ncbi:MAG: hypothetical protein QOG13_1606 [Sphingomonadales bacterium]|nr:hypothetical protein [Sphingomonadales bacterium]